MNLLRESGAHLHAEELDVAILLRKRLEAGSGCVTPAEGEIGQEGPNRIRLVMSPEARLEERRARKLRCWELAGV